MKITDYIFCGLLLWIALELLALLKLNLKHKRSVSRRKVHSLTIFGEFKMADMGKQFLFSVVAKNSEGVIVADVITSVMTDNGNVAWNPDGSNGVLVPATSGTATLTAKDANGLTATLSVPVVNNTPVTIEIVPTP